MQVWPLRKFLDTSVLRMGCSTHIIYYVRSRWMIRRTTSSNVERVGLAIGAGAWVCLLVASGINLCLSVPLWDQMFGPGLLAIGGMFALGAVIYVIGWLRARAVIKQYNYRLCPRCTYPLQHGASESVTCPECGLECRMNEVQAHWRRIYVFSLTGVH